MLSVNLVGNLGNDAEIVSRQDGTQYVRMRVACNYKSKNSPEKTEWIDCTYNYAQAGVVPFLKKGTCVHVMGEMFFGDPYLSSNGVYYNNVKVRVLSIGLVGGKKNVVSNPGIAPSMESNPGYAPKTSPAMGVDNQGYTYVAPNNNNFVPGVNQVVAPNF